MDVGLAIKWPNDTLACDGTDLMLGCIANNQGAIGYLDAGRGWSVLQEVRLRNSDGRFITSQVAAKEGGIVSSTFNKTFPSSNDLDFGSMEFFDEVKISCSSTFLLIITVQWLIINLCRISLETTPGRSYSCPMCI